MGVAETPLLGMEHKTINAYGNNYRVDQFGYDWLLHHEFADVYVYVYVYVYQASLPKLTIERTDHLMTFKWEIEGNKEFSVPVEVEIDGSL